MGKDFFGEMILPRREGAYLASRRFRGHNAKGFTLRLAEPSWCVEVTQSVAKLRD